MQWRGRSIGDLCLNAIALLLSGVCVLTPPEARGAEFHRGLMRSSLVGSEPLDS